MSRAAAIAVVLAALAPAVRGQEADYRLVEAYEEGLRVPDTAVKLEILRQLALVPPTPEGESLAAAMTPTLRSIALDDTSPLVRRQAVRTLAAFVTPGALEALHEALEAPDATVRYEAVLALARVGDGSTYPHLRRRLVDPVPYVRREAAKALLSVQDRADRPAYGPPR